MSFIFNSLIKIINIQSVKSTSLCLFFSMTGNFQLFKSPSKIQFKSTSRKKINFKWG